jgi:hypothetical protein
LINLKKEKSCSLNNKEKKMIQAISSFYFNTIEEAIVELIDKEVFDRVVCLENNDYTIEEISEILKHRKIDGIPSVNILVESLIEQTKGKFYTYVFDPLDDSPYYYIQKISNPDAPSIGEPEKAMFLSAFPVNPRPFLHRINEVIKLEGTDAIKSDKVKACLWVLNAQAYGQLATIDLCKEWDNLNKTLNGGE